MSYLVQEIDGTSKITLEDGSGFLLLEIDAVGQARLNVGDMICIASEDLGSMTAVSSENEGNFIAVSSEDLSSMTTIKSEDEGNFIGINSYDFEEMKVILDG